MKKAAVFITLLFVSYLAMAQNAPYGNNPAAGKYLQVGDARIYYEVYGEGKPLLLLHGDFFGYIGEFSGYIPILSKYYRVIAVAKRGHGKSEMGNQPFSEKLFAEDALAVLKHETSDSATVVGFSAGGITALYLAAYYPDKIKKVVGMGAGLGSKGFRPEREANLKGLDYKNLEKNAAGFIEARKKLMPQPERFPELLDRLKKCWFVDVFVEEEKAKTIKCPVLIIGGDRDANSTIDRFVSTYLTIPHAQLAIIPNCDHVGLVSKPDMFQSVALPFLNNQ